MLEPLARIGGIESYNARLSAEVVREKLQQGHLEKSAAIAWAEERLLAYRMADARSVLRGLFPLSDESSTDIPQKINDQNAAQSQWEYETAFRNGNLSMGMNLYAQHEADLRKAGRQLQDNSATLLETCGKVCVSKRDWHNAIASFQKAGATHLLQSLRKVLDNSDDDEAVKYAEILRRELGE